MEDYLKRDEDDSNTLSSVIPCGVPSSNDSVAAAVFRNLETRISDEKILVTNTSLSLSLFLVFDCCPLCLPHVCRSCRQFSPNSNPHMTLAVVVILFAYPTAAHNSKIQRRWGWVVSWETSCPESNRRWHTSCSCVSLPFPPHIKNWRKGINVKNIRVIIVMQLVNDDQEMSRSGFRVSLESDGITSQSHDDLSPDGHLISKILIITPVPLHLFFWWSLFLLKNCVLLYTQRRRDPLFSVEIIKSFKTFLYDVQ